MGIIAGLIILAAGSLLVADNRTALGLLAALFCGLVYLAAVLKMGQERTNKIFLYLIIASIPFPYLVQFQGKDAATVTTLLILVVFFCGMFRMLANRQWADLKADSLAVLPMLMAVSFTVTTALNRNFLGPSIRYYLANITGVLMYMSIMHTFRKKQDILTAAKVILAVLAVQAAFAFLQLRFPALAAQLNIFGTRVGTPEAMFVEGIDRATGTMWDYELLAEWFLIGTLLCFYLVFETRKLLYGLFLLVNLAGMVFTKTRSSMLLFAISCLVIAGLLKLFKKDDENTALKLCGMTLACLAGVMLVFPSQIGDLALRLKEYFFSKDMASAHAINRDYVWFMALSLLRRPTLFGAGLYNVESVYALLMSFHSLYLTLLYKVGLAGLAVHALFWLALFRQALRTLLGRRQSAQWYGVFFFSVMLALMLIEGIKIEYLRHAQTMHFAWLVFGLMAAVLRQAKDADEDTLVS